MLNIDRATTRRFPVLLGQGRSWPMSHSYAHPAESFMTSDMKFSFPRHINVLRKLVFLQDAAMQDPGALRATAAVESMILGDLALGTGVALLDQHSLFASNFAHSKDSLQGFTVYQHGDNFAVMLGGEGLKVSYFYRSGNSGEIFSVSDMNNLPPSLSEGASKNIKAIFSNNDFHGTLVCFDSGNMIAADALNLDLVRRQIEESGRKLDVMFVSTLPERHYVKSESLGVAALRGFLYNCLGNAVATRHIDLQFGSSREEVLNEIENSVPDIVGISSKVLAHADTMRLLSERALHPGLSGQGTMYVAGNMDATKFAGELASSFHDVIAVRKEGEFPFLDLVLHGFGKKPLSDIAQLTYWDESSGSVLSNPTGDIFRYMPGYYPPLREDLDTILESGANTYVEGSRGCAGPRCSFCVMWEMQEKEWRGKAPEDVVDEMALLHRAGAKRVYLTDSDIFGPDPGSVDDLGRTVAFSLLKKAATDVPFFAYARTRSVYKATDDRELRRAKVELLNMLKEAGVDELFIGIDAANSDQCDRYRKGSTEDERRNAIQIALGLGIKRPVFGMIIYDPFMSLQELRYKIQFINDTRIWENLYFAGKGMSLYEGTSLTEMAQRDGLITGDCKNDLRVYKYKYKDPLVAKLVVRMLFFNRSLFDLILLFRKYYRDTSEHEREMDPFHRSIGVLYSANYAILADLADKTDKLDDAAFEAYVDEQKARWIGLFSDIVPKISIRTDQKSAEFTIGLQKLIASIS